MEMIVIVVPCWMDVGYYGPLVVEIVVPQIILMERVVVLHLQNQDIDVYLNDKVEITYMSSFEQSMIARNNS